MGDERYTFEQARLRLEEIAVQARKKDTTLEKSLDLLEEGARLALMCTDLVDHTDFGDTAQASSDQRMDDASDEGPDTVAESVADGTPVSEGDGSMDDAEEPTRTEDEGSSVS